MKSHRYQLRAFVEWYKESGVDNLVELDDRGLYELCVWGREGNFGVEDGEAPEEAASVILKSQLTTLRTFPRFTANIHAVSENLYERVPLLKLSGMDDVDDPTLESDRVTGILEYLHHYHYAFRRHVKFASLWGTGARAGMIHGLDLRDLDLDGRMPVVWYKHRSDQGTPTKDGEKEERSSSVFDRVGMML